MRLRVEVEPELLKWACARSERSVNDLSNKFADLPKWIKKEKTPTIKQIEKFAQATFVPVGRLFASQPPVEKIPIHDFRTLKTKKTKQSSHNLLDTIYLCQQRQQWYRDHLKAEGHKGLSFVGSASTKRSIKKTAQDICSKIGFSSDKRKNKMNWEQNLNFFRSCVEEAGVSVMINGVVGNNTRRRLDVKEFRGFALCDKVAPLIFVNGADAKSAQIFTIAHELAHIWLGKSALTNVGLQDVENDQKIEAWCNKVAAEILVPIDQLEGVEVNNRTLQTSTDQLVKKYKVSSLVILRRLLDANKISRPVFNKAYKLEVEKFKARESKKTGGGDFYRTLTTRVGKTFAREVAASTWSGKTSFTEAFHLLGIQNSSAFKKMSLKLGVIKA